MLPVWQTSQKPTKRACAASWRSAMAWITPTGVMALMRVMVSREGRKASSACLTAPKPHAMERVPPPPLWSAPSQASSPLRMNGVIRLGDGSYVAGRGASNDLAENGGLNLGLIYDKAQLRRCPSGGRFSQELAWIKRTSSKKSGKIGTTDAPTE